MKYTYRVHWSPEDATAALVSMTDGDFPTEPDYFTDGELEGGLDVLRYGFANRAPWPTWRTHNYGPTQKVRP